MLKRLFLLLCFLLVAGCHVKEDPNQVRVGTISGPETQLMEVAKQVAFKQAGLRVKIIEFSDYSLPNTALSDGSLDANMFQHQLFLDQEIKNKHYHLVSIAKLFVYPMGIYSQKIHHLAALRKNAIIAIPNDPSNEARALLLLKQSGLIQLKKDANGFVSARDITVNLKHLQVKELDAAQLTRALPDVDAAVINTNYAVLANLYPQRDALFSENKHSVYANLLVVREKERTDPKFNALIKALHSPKVQMAAQNLFHGQAIPAWK
jgi:D-methionine transport system substrate-binding protein